MHLYTAILIPRSCYFGTAGNEIWVINPVIRGIYVLPAVSMTTWCTTTPWALGEPQQFCIILLSLMLISHTLVIPTMYFERE